MLGPTGKHPRFVPSSSVLETFASADGVVLGLNRRIFHERVSLFVVFPAKLPRNYKGETKVVGTCRAAHCTGHLEKGHNGHNARERRMDLEHPNAGVLSTY